MPPTFVTGELWGEIGKADLLLVTGNATVRRDGALVMGRGAALEATQRFPSLPYILGKMIPESPNIKPFQYGVLIAKNRYKKGSTLPETTDLGVFQVKYRWQEPAIPDLIAYSARILETIYSRVMFEGRLIYPRIVMNYPGIGNGGLRREDVEPLLLNLPSHVHIYTKGEGL